MVVVFLIARCKQTTRIGWYGMAFLAVMTTLPCISTLFQQTLAARQEHRKELYLNKRQCAQLGRLSIAPSMAGEQGHFLLAFDSVGCGKPELDKSWHDCWRDGPYTLHTWKSHKQDGAEETSLPDMESFWLWHSCSQPA